MTVTEWTSQMVDNIRAEMSRRRKTQAELASLLGMAQSGISQRMNGKVPFDVEEIYSIALWLDVPITTLLPDHQGTTAESSGDDPSDIPFPRQELVAA